MKRYIDFILKVQEISKIGKLYSKDPYAIENYEELEKISHEMLSEFTNIDFEKPNYFEKNIYPTPNVSVRTVVLKENKVAWVQENKNNLWSLPGGWAELWKTPSESAVKECREELGAEVKLTRLLGVLDRSQYKKIGDIPDYTIIFLGEYVNKISAPCHEIKEVKFYGMEHLPELSTTLHKDEIIKIYDAIKNNSVIYN